LLHPLAGRDLVGIIAFLAMNTPLTPAPLQTVGADPTRVTADWLVVPVFEHENGTELSPLGPALAAEAARMLAPGDFRAKRFDWLAATPRGESLAAERLVLVAAGPPVEYTPDVARRLCAAAVLAARERRVGRLALVHRLPATGQAVSVAPPDWIAAEAEGLTLGEFDPWRYKTGDADRRANPALTLIVPGADAAPLATARTAAERGRVVAHCVNLARELVNEPGNVLPPRVLADRAREIVDGTALAIEVLDEAAIAELGMGLLLGVAQGSHERPRLIAVSHAPADAPASPVLGLVGKGVTFDTGGISIKSADGMERMKDDMAGGAAVLLALRAISLLGLPLKVVGVVPAVENMPGGRAIRPGDVLRGASGRTVEVLNTDAEGRLILGDALWYARRLGATHLVDVATLTGACAVALGKTTSGAFGRPDEWRDRVCGAANACGERTWPLPVFDDYRELLKSEIADTTNSGGRYAGAITAAVFVGEFAGGLPWAHLDVAGTAWNDEAKAYLPKGPTGVGVRSLVNLAAALSSR
jgi:leucyl aminopeptidase